MSSFLSYTFGQDDIRPEPEQDTGPRVVIRDGNTMHRVTMLDDVAVETSQVVERTTSAELNPWHGTESFAATACNPDGMPVTELLPSTLVMLDGVQAPVSFWVSEGRLQRAQDGTYTEGPGNAPEMAADTSDILPMPSESMDQVNQALDPLPQASLESMIGVGMGAAVGRLDQSVLVQTFSRESGCDPEESAARVSAIQDAYQAQADAALRMRYGIDAADHADLWAWARINCLGQLQEAVQKQLRSHDVSGYKVIAEKWRANNAPSVRALKDAGYPIRTELGRQEVYVQGSWMSASAAARAGLL